MVFNSEYLRIIERDDVMSILNYKAIVSGPKGDQGIQGNPAPTPLKVVGTSNIAFTNTSTTETNILNIPANYLTVGSNYELRLTGSVVKTSVVNSNLVINLKLNSTNILVLTMALGTATFTGNGRGFEVQGMFTVRANGVSGSLFSELSGVVSTNKPVTSNITNTTTVNTTIANTVTIRANSSNANTTGTIRSYTIKEVF